MSVAQAMPALPGMEEHVHTDAGESDQFYPTPPAATRAILSELWPSGYPGGTVCDLGAGDGHITQVLREAGCPREAITAVELRGQCAERLSRLAGGVLCPSDATLLDGAAYDWCFSNPPFGLMLPFAKTMVRLTKPGGRWAMLALLAFAETQDRYPFLTEHPVDAYVFRDRVDFGVGGSNPRPHAWFVGPSASPVAGVGLWRPLPIYTTGGKPMRSRRGKLRAL